MTAVAFSQFNWERALLAEARRDVVFVFNIVSGAFGGPKPAPAQDEQAALLERVAGVLLKGGCTVGFLTKGTDEPALPERLLVQRDHLAKEIARFYAENPEDVKFLAFLHRAPNEATVMPNPAFQRTAFGGR